MERFLDLSSGPGDEGLMVSDDTSAVSRTALTLRSDTPREKLREHFQKVCISFFF